MVQDNVPVPIVDGLFMGSIHCSFNEQGIKEAGVTHIINTSGTPATYPQSFTYLCITIRDKDYANLLSCIPACNIFIESGLESGGNVLVHCTGGRSRSAAIITAYLMSSLQYTFDHAFSLVKGARSLANCNSGFERQLRAFESSHFDVHAAQQLLLRDHLRELQNRRDDAVRKLASTTLSNPIRIKLMRPNIPAAHVIPPLRGADIQYICRKCPQPLFCASSIIRHHPTKVQLPSGRTPRIAVNVRDASSQEAVKSPSRAALAPGSPPAQLPHLEVSQRVSETDGYNHGALLPTPSARSKRVRNVVPPQSTRNRSRPRGGFGFDSDSVAAARRGRESASSTHESSTTNRAGQSFRLSLDSLSLDEHDAATNKSQYEAKVSARDTYNPYESKVSARRDDSESATATEIAAQLSARKKRVMSSDNRTSPSGARISASASAGELARLHVPRTPPRQWSRDDRQSWLERMKLLECGITRSSQGKHRPSIIAAADEKIAPLLANENCKFASRFPAHPHAQSIGIAPYV